MMRTRAATRAATRVVPRAAHRAVLIAALAACAPAHLARTTAPVSSKRELTEDQQVAHVLSRLTFGPRPGDAERVKAMGVDKWIDQQLHPDHIVDARVDSILGGMSTWTLPVSEVAFSSVVRITTTTPRKIDTIKTADGVMFRVTSPASSTINMSGQNQFYSGKIIQAQIAERQLFEVMVDFWENHFSVYTAKVGGQEALLAWERDVIRPHAMGNFRDLLTATAKSPAMLTYLDNQLSRKNALNENYAREIMELHTLGVDGGYTQDDVINVARAFTGWMIRTVPQPQAAAGVAQRTPQRVFAFTDAQHDSGEKVVLGQVLRAGRGITDGEDVLNLLASHPSTARYIAFKIARRLVSDDPPAALVARAAATFLRTDGEISEVVRTIVTSPEFFSRAAFRAKTKNPFELMISAKRALEAPADTTVQTNALLTRQGQPFFGRLTPDGWPDRGEAWLNSGSIMNRILLASDIAAGKQQAFPVAQWRGWDMLSQKLAPEQATGVLKLIFGGYVDEGTRGVLLKNNYKVDPTDGKARLAEMLAMVLGSPEFQRR